jgi:hypothetical protein
LTRKTTRKKVLRQTPVSGNIGIAHISNINLMNILFVCTINKMRSLTAERIYQKDERFKVKSAGTD